MGLGAWAGLAPKANAGALRTQAAEANENSEEKNQNPESWSYHAGADLSGYKHASLAAVEAWKDRKFGMRIHWGVYAVLGLDASMPLIGADREFHTIWFTLFQAFNPTQFDAEEWVDLAERAGMKYFTFSTRHLDGFSMWDTKTKVWSVRRLAGGHGGEAAVGLGPTEMVLIPYSMMDTLYPKDIVGELVTAFRKRGMGVGLYFSWPDFHDPKFKWDKRSQFYDPHFSKKSDPQAWRVMIDRITESLRELSTNYGKIDAMEFDHGLPEEAWPDTARIVKMVRELQPDCLLRNRGIGPYGDFSTPEHYIPSGPEASQLGGRPWQAIECLGKRWAYQPSDVYKPTEWLVTTLVEVCSMGGNFMPGISPMSNGKYPPQTVERLEYVGDWLKVNGEAIYNTRPWNVYKEENVRFTRTKDNRYVYAISLEWPGDSVTLRSVRAKQGSAISMLGVKGHLRWKQDRNGLVIQIPSAIEERRPCKQAYAFKIEAQPYREMYT
jgi:alpha-L-fucosidase